jgi:hypothetical protein
MCSHSLDKHSHNIIYMSEVYIIMMYNLCKCCTGYENIGELPFVVQVATQLSMYLELT